MQISDSKPEEVRVKSDNSFMVTFSTPVEAMTFLKTRELFSGDYLVQLEPWTL